MRYMTIYKTEERAPAPPSPQEMATMGKFIQELAEAGVLVTTDGLQHSSKGARVRIANGQFTVTDGPFTESKELIAGYAIFEVKSRAEILELTKRFLSIMGQGESEIRLMQDQPAYQRV